MEGQFDACTEDLFNQTIKLEDMEKKAGNAEGQVGDLARRLLLLEENAVKAEFLTKISTTKSTTLSFNISAATKSYFFKYSWGNCRCAGMIN